MKRMLFIALAIALVAMAYDASAQLFVPNHALLIESDSESYFSAPNDPAFNDSLERDGYTIECWTMPTAEGGERMVFNKEDAWEVA
ncbi:MAG: hypothetical protein O7E52_13110, partial [Candidatus Poribacteria bacterium]|nr:hypothetical protein [Candidatus Poribacteria bacterium]